MKKSIVFLLFLFSSVSFVFAVFNYNPETPFVISGNIPTEELSVSLISENNTQAPSVIQFGDLSSLNNGDSIISNEVLGIVYSCNYPSASGGILYSFSSVSMNVECAGLTLDDMTFPIAVSFVEADSNDEIEWERIEIGFGNQKTNEQYQQFRIKISKSDDFSSIPAGDYRGYIYFQLISG